MESNFDDGFVDFLKEQRKAIDLLNQKVCSKETAGIEAAFLLRWSKGKNINLVTHDATFWSCGRAMTKIAPDVVNGLVEHGLATEIFRDNDRISCIRINK